MSENEPDGSEKTDTAEALPEFTQSKLLALAKPPETPPQAVTSFRPAKLGKGPDTPPGTAKPDSVFPDIVRTEPAKAEPAKVEPKEKSSKKQASSPDLEQVAESGCCVVQ
eukprot:TRINITY_DN14788_c0_g2_i4.p1 TRINITY_DN14788_c0_g2~~TRINITY_DN14788_c0_g2_i4.p1  ORF type:complete len:110 (-),score=13.34 TRINITY_DN14788_c0_g2_i4:174-503(-)